MHDVSYQEFLAVVGGQNGDLLSGHTLEPQVHEQSHHELSLGQVLIEKWLRSGLPIKYY